MFLTFDVVEFYPSISDTLLNAALDFAAKYTNISAEDRNIIIKAKSSILFNEGNPWGTKSSQTLFDVTMVVTMVPKPVNLLAPLYCTK